MKFFNNELERFIENGSPTDVEEFIHKDRTQIGFSDSLFKRLLSKHSLRFEEDKACLAEYRPFSKMWCYYDRNFIERVYQTHKFFLSPDLSVPTICISGIGLSRIFIVGTK